MVSRAARLCPSRISIVISLMLLAGEAATLLTLHFQRWECVATDEDPGCPAGQLRRFPWSPPRDKSSLLPDTFARHRSRLDSRKILPVVANAAQDSGGFPPTPILFPL